MQQWIGYACWKAPASPTYNIPYLIELRGTLNVDILRQALQRIIERHDPLRSAFRVVEGEAQITVRDEVALLVLARDLTTLSSEEAMLRADAEANELARRPFDLTSDLLIRVSLWHLPEGRHLLLLNIHHLVFDGWSQSVLLRELSQLYTALIEGQDPVLPDLPVRCRDHTAWKRQLAAAQPYREHLDYWQRKLAGTAPSLDLPTDRPRPEIAGNHGGYTPLSIPAELVSDLKRLSDEAGVTLFMTLMAAWQVLLYRYCRQEDFVVCFPTAERTPPETEALIGCLLNLLLLRADMSGPPTVRELLARVREGILEAHAHGDVSIDHLKHVPRLQVMFAFQNTPDARLELPGLDATVRLLHTGTAKCELSLDLEETAHGLEGWIEYDADLYDRQTMARLADHLQRLLAGFPAGLDRPISELALASEAERHCLLTEWNRTEVAYPRDATIHELFAAQVEATPDQIALVQEGEQLTYRQLDARANRIAHLLQGAGVGPGTLVGLCMERSPDMIAAMLGILKAGGAYVPLDPTYPRERLAFMLRDTAVPVLVTQSDLAERLAGYDTHILCIDREGDREAGRGLDQDEAQIATLSTYSAVSGVGAGAPAYVIYTSGSTGQPKGVCIPHRGVVRLVRAADYVELSGAETLLQFAPISFDAATFEIWGALLNGGRLVLYPNRVPTPRELGEFLREQGITTLWLTAGLFHLMVDEALEDLRCVRQVLAGGDVLSPERARRFLQAAPGSTLINGYGPTENTTFTCCYPMTRPEQVGATVSIGRPIANTQVYLLDEALQPVPVGVVGELTIGGDGLAEGYLNRPDLTAERFIAAPFGELPQSRLYRSGDLARWLPNGTLEFLGRRDAQVKIRGFRVEMGEVEAALEMNPLVHQAAVLVREGGKDGGNAAKYLVGYVVLAERPDGWEAALGEALRTRLPEYMVPARFVAVDAIPLTPNGKLDRNFLHHLPLETPRPASVLTASVLTASVLTASIPATSSLPATSRNEMERRLSDLWAEVLDVPTPDVTTSFFALGGHSLSAIRLLAAVEREFGKRLSLATMLKASTIRAMADLLRNAQAEGDVKWTSLVPLQTRGDLPPLFCAPVGGGSAFYYRALSARIGADQPLYTLEPRGMNGIDPPHETIEEMAAYYIDRIRAVQPYGPYRLCGLSLGGVIAFEMARQLVDSGAGVACLILFDAWAPGYPRYRPGWSERLPTIRSQLAYKIGYHRENLLVCSGARERIAYLGTRWGRLCRKVAALAAGKPWDPERHNPSSTRLPALYRQEKLAEEHALERYCPQVYPGGMVLLRARCQQPEHLPDAQMGWQGLAQTGIEVIEVPGTHYSLLEEPCVRVTVTHIRRMLAQALQRREEALRATG